METTHRYGEFLHEHTKPNQDNAFATQGGRDLQVSSVRIGPKLHSGR